MNFFALETVMFGQRTRTGLILRRTLYVLTTLLTVVGIFAFVMLSFGRVDGVEFSPEQLSRRKYFYYQIPLVQLQVTPVVRTVQGQDLENHLNSLDFLRSKDATDQWHPVTVYHGSNIIDGNAKILCNYLDTSGEEGDLLWLTWTEDEANKKKIQPFWSTVQQAAKLNAYFVIPSLFQVASKSLDAQAFEKELHEVARQQYHDAATDFASINQSEIADKYFEAAREQELALQEAMKNTNETNGQQTTD